MRRGGCRPGWRGLSVPSDRMRRRGLGAWLTFAMLRHQVRQGFPLQPKGIRIATGAWKNADAVLLPGAFACVTGVSRWRARVAPVRRRRKWARCR